jgi:transposase-like protein
MSRKTSRRQRRVRSIVAVAGAERSEAEDAATIEAPDVRRGRPGRRSTEERTRAVLELLAGKASVDQLALRFGVQAQTIERWREQALEGIAGALREGGAESARERELVRQVADLEKTVTSLAIQRELLQRAASTRPTRPGRSSR